MQTHARMWAHCVPRTDRSLHFNSYASDEQKGFAEITFDDMMIIVRVLDVPRPYCLCIRRRSVFSSPLRPSLCGHFSRAFRLSPIRANVNVTFIGTFNFVEGRTHVCMLRIVRNKSQSYLNLLSGCFCPFSSSFCVSLPFHRPLPTLTRHSRMLARHFTYGTIFFFHSLPPRRWLSRARSLPFICISVFISPKSKGLLYFICFYFLRRDISPED